ncbi:MAG TPA: hypothetical protein VLF43_04845, partial [Candidatus Saccharimonadales bacterium]|nr:hypothetical protein [Candidatus Saccharimonadales bacterium]
MKLPRKAQLTQFWLRYRYYWPYAILVAGIIIAACILFAPSSAANDGPAKTVSQSLTDLSSCTDATRFDCYSDYFKSRTTTTSAKTALAELKQLYDQGDSYAISQCHQIAHQIGHAGYDKYKTLAHAFESGDTFCWSGYYHGVTERAVAILGKDKLKGDANNICKDLATAKQYSFEHYNCVHGLGHGFMAVDNYNLFDALKTCDLLTDSWERASCYGGVFMENVMVDVRQNGKSDFLKADQPMYPCTAVEESYKYQCY